MLGAPPRRLTPLKCVARFFGDHVGEDSPFLVFIETISLDCTSHDTQPMHTSTPHLRIARPVSDLVRAVAMYRSGLGLRVVGTFADHDGFDGVMLGRDGASYHFEFTHCRAHPVVPHPTPEDLVVFYLPDRSEWKAACVSMAAAGFVRVPSFNPYWETSGATFRDLDGYRLVLQHASWNNVERA